MKMTPFLATLSLAAWAANAHAAPELAGTFDMDDVINGVITAGAFPKQKIFAEVGPVDSYYAFGSGSEDATLFLDSMTVTTNPGVGRVVVVDGLMAELSETVGFGGTGINVTPEIATLSPLTYTPSNGFIFVAAGETVYFNVKWNNLKNSGFESVFSATPIPVPAALPLLGGALAALGALGAVRRRRDA